MHARRKIRLEPLHSFRSPYSALIHYNRPGSTSSLQWYVQRPSDERSEQLSWHPYTQTSPCNQHPPKTDCTYTIQAKTARLQLQLQLHTPCGIPVPSLRPRPIPTWREFRRTESKMKRLNDYRKRWVTCRFVAVLGVFVEI